jgi:hypothetical protein
MIINCLECPFVLDEEEKESCSFCLELLGVNTIIELGENE